MSVTKTLEVTNKTIEHILQCIRVLDNRLSDLERFVGKLKQEKVEK